LNLLRDLQRAHGLALIFITHNLGIVAKMCDQLAVMYAGRVVESGPVSRIFNAPSHPYTKALLNSIPRMSDTDQRLVAIEGQTPGIVGESGCGKTTTAKLVLGLEQPTGGTMRFEDRDLKELDAAGRRNYRKSVQAVFQDPYASLSPRMRIDAIIAEPLITNE